MTDAIENRIFDQVEKIASFPMSVPESDLYPGTRKLAFTPLPYVAFIRLIKGNRWEVVDIVHTARKLPKNA